MKFMVTGAAGFIGFHTSSRLLADGHEVVGYDAFTPYYDPALKERRSELLRDKSAYTEVRGTLEDFDLLKRTVHDFAPDVVIHLAAQAGVRYSIENPGAYISSNVQGLFNLLEVLRETPPRHLLMASTSSVYGGNTAFPFEETHRIGFPVSIYAATKAAGESLTHSYSSLFGIPTTCFRFFTVYGPWGRPDMAPIKFTERILSGTEIEVYGNGELSRDFTYVDDIVEGIVRLVDTVPVAGDNSVAGDIDSLSPVAPWRVVNIAGGHGVPLMDFIATLEQAIGIEAKKVFLPRQPGDVVDTLASPALLEKLTGFRPSIPVTEGLPKFVDWYRAYREGDA